MVAWGMERALGALSKSGVAVKHSRARIEIQYHNYVGLGHRTWMR